MKKLLLTSFWHQFQPELVTLIFFVFAFTSLGQVSYIEQMDQGSISSKKLNQVQKEGNFFNDSLFMPLSIVFHDVKTKKDMFLKKTQETSKLSCNDSNAIPRFSNGFNPFRDTIEPMLDNFGSNTSFLPNNNPASWPSCVHCKLIIHFGNIVHEASGVLIDSRAVLTSGHVLYNPAWGGWADQVEVIPAYSAPNKPFGNSMGEYFSVVEHWYYQDEYKEQFDLGVVLLGRPIGALTGWYGFASATDDFFFSHNFWNFNYPSAAPATNCCMYYRSGAFDAIYNNEILAVNNTYEPGQDGSGAYYNDPTYGREVYGVLSTAYPPPVNNQTAFVRISWLKWIYINNTLNGYTPNSPLLMPLQVLINPTTIQPGQNFTSFTFKVHNYSFSTFSGQQDVIIYLSSDKNITSSDTIISQGYFSATINSWGTLTVNVSNISIPCMSPSSSKTYYLGIALGSQVTGNQDVGQVLVIRPDPTANFTTALNWTSSSTFGDPIGVVADGGATIKLIVNKTTGNLTVNNLNAELQSIQGQVSGPLGTIGTSIQSATGTTCSMPGSAGNNQWVFYYKAPDVFSSDLNNKVAEKTIKAVVKISVGTSSNTDCYKIEKEIKIVRPPVLLIHGLHDSQKCFSKLKSELELSQRYNNFQVMCVDYESTNFCAFAENVRHVECNIAGIKKIWKSKQYEVAKVDLVGHSMGGVLSRLYQQSNRYQDDIHKLITVNTPHSGSQGANILFSLPEDVRTKLKFNDNATRDLQVNSAAILQDLNGSTKSNHKVPSHAITTETTSLAPAFYSICNNNIIGFAFYFILKKWKFSEGLLGLLESIPPIIYNGASDLVVAKNSQIGGLNATSSFNYEWHCGSPNNPLVKNRIKELLELPSTGSTFSISGFNPPILPPPFVLPTKQSINVNDTIHILQPIAGTSVSPGQNIPLNIAGTAGIHDILIQIRESRDSILMIDTTASSLNHYYTVPQISCGIIDIIVFGLDTLGNIYLDSTYLYAPVSGTPDSLFITFPKDSLMLSQGFQGSIYVSGLFQDSIVRDLTTLPEVQYTIHSNKINYISQGVFKGIHQGKDTITVSYGGLSVNLPVDVGQYYTQVDSVNRYDTICEGSSYNFYGQSYSITGIYDTSFVNQYGSDSIIFLHLKVLPQPEGLGSIIGPENVCLGQAGVTYSVNSVLNATAYTWSVPAGVSIVSGAGTNSIVVNFPNSISTGNFQVYSSNQCFDGQASPTFAVSTNVLYSGHVAFGNVTIGSNQKDCRSGQVITVGGAGNPLVIQPGGTANLLASEKILIYPGTTVYNSGYLHAFITNLCIPCSAMKSTGMDSSESIFNASHKNFRIIPNPTTGIFSIEMIDRVTPVSAEVKLYNILGDLILQSEMKNVLKMEVSLENEKPGLYLVKINMNDFVETFKIIKK